MLLRAPVFVCMWKKNDFFEYNGGEEVEIQEETHFQNFLCVCVCVCTFF